MTQSVNTINSVQYTRGKNSSIPLHDERRLKESLKSDYNALLQHVACKILFENSLSSPSNQMRITLSIKRKHITAENKDIYQITVINKNSGATASQIIQTTDLNSTLASIFHKTIGATQPPAASSLSPRLSAKRPHPVSIPSSPQKQPSQDLPSPEPIIYVSPKKEDHPVKKSKPTKKSFWEQIKEKWKDRSSKKDYLKGHDTDKLYTNFTPKSVEPESPKNTFSFEPEDMQSPTIQEEDDALLGESPDSPSTDDNDSELSPLLEGLSVNLHPL